MTSPILPVSTTTIARYITTASDEWSMVVASPWLRRKPKPPKLTNG
jgi:hypothetical protein